MRDKVKRNILLNPGPATTTDTVKQSQVVPDICPREASFGALMTSVAIDLTRVVGDPQQYETVLFGGAGTAAMEACLTSVAPCDGRKVLIVNNGSYGKRFCDIADAFQIPFYELNVASNQQVTCEAVEKVLQTESISSVVIVHHETTTGLVNPISEIGAVVKKYSCVFIVDAMSSYAGLPISMKDSKIDFLISSSNKCIQGMPGLSFVICEKQALENIKGYPTRSYYLNLYKQYAYFKQTLQLRFTPPVQVVYALRQALDEFIEEGAENRYERYRYNFLLLCEGLKRLGLTIYLPEEKHAGILVSVYYPEKEGFSFDWLHDQLLAKGFTIYPGKLMDENLFRLAIIGDLSENDINLFLVTLEALLRG
jgi:2-aminoethylphosphonate aminotransferase